MKNASIVENLGGAMPALKNPHALRGWQEDNGIVQRRLASTMHETEKETCIAGNKLPTGELVEKDIIKNESGRGYSMLLG